MLNPLKVEKIRKSYGKKIVLKDVSFKVFPKSIVGFIGDNGAGKSTTFKTILELVSKDSGSIEIFGKENLNKNVQIKEDIGVVFDAMNLPAHLTVKQLNKVFRKLFNSWNQDNFYRLIKVFSLPLDKKVNKFSRGMSMKLSVSVALSHNAKLLILDEATGGLDPSSREVLLEELTSFVNNDGGSVLLSSHIMSDIEKIATHIIFIKDGEVLLNIEKDKFYENYAVIEINEKKLALIDKSIIVRKRNSGSYLTVLVSDKRKLPNEILAKTISMDELSIFLTRSVS